MPWSRRRERGRGGARGARAGGTWVSDQWNIQRYLNDHGIALDAAFVSGNREVFDAVARSLTQRRAPVVVNVPEHTLVIDGERSRSGGGVTYIYERVNSGHGGGDDYWALRDGTWYDEVRSAWTFTAR